MRYMTLLLLALLGGCNRRERPSQDVEGEKWTQLRNWSARAEGTMMGDIDVSSKRWRLLLQNSGDDYLMVGVADAHGEVVAMGTATEKDVDTIQVIGSTGVHKITIVKLGQDGEYRVVLQEHRE
jgi:hypothetical protein